MLSSISETVPIAHGVDMPRLGFGTYRSQPGAESEQAVTWALEAGYRSIDTAALYGNEASVGNAVRASGVPREEVFVTTKVWNDDQGYRTTLAAFERSLNSLSLDYLDLYLVHWPMPSRMRETWRAMEEIARSGRCRAIGVCNHLAHHLEALTAFASIRPAVNQVEFHPRLQQPALQQYCRANSITLEAWAPIMRGGVHHIPEIRRIAEEHERTPAQVSIRWILQRGLIAIPKSTHLERIRENADVFGFTLSDEDMAAIDSLDAAQRIGPDPNHYAE